MPHYDEARGLLASELNGPAGIITATTHAAASKATPVDADELQLVDSAASFSLKKLTWANLKATLATWINSNLIPASFLSIVSSSSVSASGAAGFYSATYVASARNPIWRFGNADPYGVSYFQGSAGLGGLDVFGFHFGTATAAGSQFALRSDGMLIAYKGFQPSQAAGYVSSDGSPGYTGTVTTASLVGKTITIKDGIITGFA